MEKENKIIKRKSLATILLVLSIMIVFGTILTIVEFFTSANGAPIDYIIYLITTLLAYLMIITYTTILYKLPGRQWLVLLIVMVAIYQAWIIIKTTFFETIPLPVTILMCFMLFALICTALAPDHRSKVILGVTIVQIMFSIFGCITGEVPEYVSVQWLFKMHWFALPIMEFCIWTIFMNKKIDKTEAQKSE